MLDGILQWLSEHPQLVLLFIVVTVFYILNQQYNYVGQVCTKLGHGDVPVTTTPTPTA